MGNAKPSLRRLHYRRLPDDLQAQVMMDPTISTILAIYGTDCLHSPKVTSLSLFCGQVFSLWSWTEDGWVHHSGHSLHRSLLYLVSSINLRQDLKHGKLPLLNIVPPMAAGTILSNGCTLRLI